MVFCIRVFDLVVARFFCFSFRLNWTIYFLCTVFLSTYFYIGIYTHTRTHENKAEKWRTAAMTRWNYVLFIASTRFDCVRIEKLFFLHGETMKAAKKIRTKLLQVGSEKNRKWTFVTLSCVFSPSKNFHSFRFFVVSIERISLFATFCI